MGTSAAYRGYRLQALYSLNRILGSNDGAGLVYHPEGFEGLDIERKDGSLTEIIQVKSYNAYSFGSPLAVDATNMLWPEDFSR